MIYAGCVVDAAGAWANVLAARIGIVCRWHQCAVNIGSPRPIRCFPATIPWSSCPDASAYSRPELGGFVVRVAGTSVDQFRSAPVARRLVASRWVRKAAGRRWKKAHRDCASFLPALDQLKMASHISGLSTYTPDGLFVLGPAPGLQDFGCHRLLVPGSRRWRCRAGCGRLAAGLPSPFDLTPFRVDRFGPVDPLSPAFRQRCEQARSSKTSG